ncbi:metalloregulator ArsR/SmtB family transcription factor [Amycolatopsis carbonis]|uniref:Metalloregulator ArsR/SmtB family transcription factor n=1 Tax=Amycolatopsis carbonis TaxID=715471 RepID=A0A9Y2MSV5_9PSEU|nr:metalloregulator ArsR/SmtB family transcription factor [Amycolatopsis sp. 2-15]WIX76253.1 metalloregulator ArsR/SmtB family transcription factor [Amycolatopsis sp. 2-15]
MPVNDDVFAALANPARREVLRLLLEGPMAAGDLAVRFDMRRPSLSEHLRVLREAGLVTEQRAGRNRVYSLEAAPLEEVTTWLHPFEQFWRTKLSNLRDLLDEEDL